MSTDIELIPWARMSARQQLTVEDGSGVLFENMITSPRRALFVSHWAQVSAKAKGVDLSVEELLDKLTFDDIMALLEGLPDDMGSTRPPGTAPTGAPPDDSSSTETWPPSPSRSAALLPKSSTPTPS